MRSRPVWWPGELGCCKSRTCIDVCVPHGNKRNTDPTKNSSLFCVAPSRLTTAAAALTIASIELSFPIIRSVRGWSPDFSNITAPFSSFASPSPPSDGVCPRRPSARPPVAQLSQRYETPYICPRRSRIDRKPIHGLARASHLTAEGAKNRATPLGNGEQKKSGPRCGESIHPFPVLCCSPANQARWSRPVPVLEPAGAAGKDREDCVRAGTVCNLTIRACVFPRTKRLASARQAEPPQICFCPPRAGMIPAGRARTSFAEHACPLPFRCRVCIASGVGWEPAQLRYGCSCGISAMGFLQMMAIASAFRISLVGGIEKRGMGWQQQGRVEKEGRGRFPGHSLTAMT